MDEETDQLLLNAIVTIYRGNELLERLNIGTSAIFGYKLACDTHYWITVSLKNYHDTVSMVKSSEKPNY